MRRLARQWGRAPVRAAALLRRPDYLQAGLNVAGIPEISPRIHLGPQLREPPNAATRELPDRELLVLDQLDTLHLIGLRGWGVARLDGELMQWRMKDVTVAVKPGKGKFRAVEIVSGEAELVLAGPWRNARQRAALELIEDETAARRQ
jgi:hypothetical protein